MKIIREYRLDGGPGSGPRKGGGSAKSSAPASYGKISTKTLTSKRAEYEEKVRGATEGSTEHKKASIKLGHIQSELAHRGEAKSAPKEEAKPVVIAKAKPAKAKEIEPKQVEAEPKAKEVDSTPATTAKSMSDADFTSARTEFTNSLDPGEVKAFKYYSDKGYENINNHLRSGGDPGVFSNIGKIDAAIAKSSPLSAETMVYRGVDSRSGDVFSSLKPGDSFIDKAYMSTSTTGAMLSSNTFFNITIPKGVKAAPIPSAHDSEREFLLPRNTKLNITRVTKTGDRTIIHATVGGDS